MGDKSDITEKAGVDQIFDDVDDGVKSARVSIAGGEDEGDEDQDEGEMNLEKDRSRHLGEEELEAHQPHSMESPEAQHNESLLKREQDSHGKIIKNMFHGEA